MQSYFEVILFFLIAVATLFFLIAQYTIDVFSSESPKKAKWQLPPMRNPPSPPPRVHPLKKKKATKIYISGKISGIESEAFELFLKAQYALQAKGYQVINPFFLPHEHDKSWHSYMKADIKALCDCDAIYMLGNWADSKGAIIENTIAMYLGLKVHYENG